jgi:uncharacterized damage-inducible protein DinB
MLVDAIRTLYGYNRWATGRVLDAAGELTAQEWLAPGVAGHGSVRDTLVHLIAVQRSWLAWWNGSLSANEAIALTLAPDDVPDLPALRAVWEEVERATAAFVDGLGEADLERVYSNTMPNGAVFRLPLWQMLLHVANHGAQHRSEVAAMLTGFGHSPGNLDQLGYFRPFGDAPAG